MVYNSSTLQPQSIRLEIFLNRALEFDVWTADFTRACLQSTDTLLRDIHVAKNMRELEIEPHECLKLLKLLDGSCDAGDQWSSTMEKHHQNVLDVSPLRSEPALYTNHNHAAVIGLSGTYIDDLFGTGTSDFRKICRATH